MRFAVWVAVVVVVVVGVVVAVVVGVGVAVGDVVVVGVAVGGNPQRPDLLRALGTCAITGAELSRPPASPATLQWSPHRGGLTLFAALREFRVRIEILLGFGPSARWGYNRESGWRGSNAVAS